MIHTKSDSLLIRKFWIIIGIIVWCYLAGKRIVNHNWKGVNHIWQKCLVHGSLSVIHILVLYESKLENTPILSFTCPEHLGNALWECQNESLCRWTQWRHCCCLPSYPGNGQTLPEETVLRHGILCVPADGQDLVIDKH